MKATLARWGYGALLTLASPLVYARWWWRGRHEPGYRAHWRERWGGFDGSPGSGRIWVHAVSLGETRAAEPLLAALRRECPGRALLLTHGTATGRAAGAALLKDGDRQAWLPLDTPFAVRSFLRRHRPVVGVMMETEVWPALLQAAHAAGVPMVLANARLSEKSLAQGRRLAALMRPAVAVFARVLAQTEPDAARLREMGATNVQVMGNLKFDITPDPQLLAQGQAWRRVVARAVVLAAVTREGEEGPLFDAWRRLPAPRPLLVVVPRHPQRFDAVAADAQALGLTLVRRSGWGEQPPPAAAEADVWLGDSMGEMPLYYALADAALLGGSFAPLGGQNLIEAAACGCPLVMGPHTFNFAQAAERSLAARASERVPTLADGVQRAVALALDPERQAWVQRALGFAGQHRGAAERMARAIAALLPR